MSDVRSPKRESLSPKVIRLRNVVEFRFNV